MYLNVYTKQGVAQWISALALGARGRAFESLHPEYHL
jgi:hypothetical protein